jgi:hypothetical protein
MIQIGITRCAANWRRPGNMVGNKISSHSVVACRNISPRLGEKIDKINGKRGIIIPIKKRWRKYQNGWIVQRSCWQKYTDIKLILVDAYNSITMDVHRVVLGCFSEYFAKLFNFDMEKNQTSIQSEPITQSISRIDKMISLSELKICSEQILSSKNNTIALSEVEIFLRIYYVNNKHNKHGEHKYQLSETPMWSQSPSSWRDNYTCE